MFGSQIAVVAERHLGRFPAQCIHDPGDVLAGREQVIGHADPR